MLYKTIAPIDECLRLSNLSSQIPHNFGFWNSGFIFDKEKNQFVLSCRNETSMHNEKYFNRKVPKEKRWESFCPSFIYFDEDLNFLSASPIIKTDNSRYEDVRMFYWKNEIYCTGTVKCPERGGVDQFIGKKINNSILRLKFFHNYKLHQKNWTPFIDKDVLYYEYSPGPLRKLLKYQYPKLIEVFQETNSFHLRGNCPPVDLGDQYLTFYHFSVNRDYYHQVAFLEKSFPFKVISMSPPFKFSAAMEKIQFLMGAVLHKNKIIVSYGVQDSDNLIGKIDLDFFKSIT